MRLFFFLLLLITSYLNASSLYSVILAGGSGERLWPISRKVCPKQLISLDGNKTFLEQAIDRLHLTLPQENIWICTAQYHANAIAQCVGDTIGRIIIEPAPKNTGPAILYSCLKLQEHDPDATVIFLPSDAYIPETDNATFAKFVKEALTFSEMHDVVTLFGLKPLYPATGYGYIEFDSNSATSPPFKITQFHEKPCYERAEQYVKSSMLWNQCTFCAKVSVLIDEFKKNAPEMYNQVIAYINGTSAYENIQKDSIDYAVMEKSDNVWVLPVDYTWYDVGTIGVFLSLKKELGLIDTKTIEYDTYNNLVDVPGKLVALLGVENLCIVEANNVLFIGKQEIIQQTRELVNQLKKINSEHL